MSKNAVVLTYECQQAHQCGYRGQGTLWRQAAPCSERADRLVFVVRLHRDGHWHVCVHACLGLMSAGGGHHVPARITLHQFSYLVAAAFFPFTTDFCKLSLQSNLATMTLVTMTFSLQLCHFPQPDLPGAREMALHITTVQ
jgi:hypothetical protein